MIDITTVQTLKEGGFQINGNMCIGPFPADPNAPIVNEGHASIKKWIDAGNTPAPYVGPSALEVWKQEMAASDAVLPRWAEDLYDGLALEIRDGISAVTKNKIVQKKAKRELRPV
jgi:hypothetical protein